MDVFAAAQQGERKSISREKNNSCWSCSLPVTTRPSFTVLPGQLSLIAIIPASEGNLLPESDIIVCFHFLYIRRHEIKEEAFTRSIVQYVVISGLNSGRT